MNIKVWQPQRSAIIELWNKGYSNAEIIEELNLDVTERTIRRIGAAYGNWRQRQLARIDRHDAVDKSALQSGAENN